MGTLNTIKMMNIILKLDYALSRWFSKTGDKIVPGTAFLFLNKVSFVWGMTLFVVAIPLGLNKSINLFVGTAVLGALIIMYVLQKPTEHYIERAGFHIAYKNLHKKRIALNRLLGLLLFILSFGLMLLTGILSMKG